MRDLCGYHVRKSVSSLHAQEETWSGFIIAVYGPERIYVDELTNCKAYMRAQGEVKDKILQSCKVKGRSWVRLKERAALDYSSHGSDYDPIF